MGDRKKYKEGGRSITGKKEIQFRRKEKAGGKRKNSPNQMLLGDINIKKRGV